MATSKFIMISKISFETFEWKDSSEMFDLTSVCVCRVAIYSCNLSVSEHTRWRFLLYPRMRSNFERHNPPSKPGWLTIITSELTKWIYWIWSLITPIWNVSSFIDHCGSIEQMQTNQITYNQFFLVLIIIFMVQYTYISFQLNVGILQREQYYERLMNYKSEFSFESIVALFHSDNKKIAGTLLRPIYILICISMSIISLNG